MCWTTEGGEKQPGHMFGRGGKVKLSKGGLLCTPLLCYTPGKITYRCNTQHATPRTTFVYSNHPSGLARQSWTFAGSRGLLGFVLICRQLVG